MHVPPLHIPRDSGQLDLLHNEYDDFIMEIIIKLKMNKLFKVLF